MSLFLLIVPRVDESPAGRAAEVLRRDLPIKFPQHSFEFMEPAEAKGMGLANADDLLFHVLASQVRSDTGEIITPEAEDQVHWDIHVYVEQAVAEAKRLASN